MLEDTAERLMSFINNQANDQEYLQALAGQRILLLQGPVGPFFKCLQLMLEEAGAAVTKIDFNSGDTLYSRGVKSVRFSGGVADWEEWLSTYLDQCDFDGIVLFGSERPAHKVARSLADQRGITLVSLEEGYVRPGFITAEYGGNNASSPIAGQIQPQGWQSADMVEGRDFKSFSRSSMLSATYYSARTMATFGRSKELFHRRFKVGKECFYWLRNAYRRYTGEARNYRLIEKLLEHYDKRFYLVPLQVAADANLQRAAMGWNSVRVITESIQSFARSAPLGTRLVFKIHPLERGHCDYIPEIMELSEKLGVADRVDVIDIGSMGLLARHCAGMITINSTSGLSAIYHGAPLMVIGKALYANPAMATCANGSPDFDTFWNSGFVAPSSLRRNYIEWVKQQCLVPGDYYSEEGIQVGCRSIVNMLGSTTTATVAPAPVTEITANLKKAASA